MFGMLAFVLSATPFAAPIPVAMGANMAPSAELDLLKVSSLSEIKTDHAKVTKLTSSTPELRLDFEIGTNYPKAEFPVPQGGWNLGEYAGVQIELRNVGSSKARAALRVDNPGDWHTSPWNTGSIEIGPGERKTLKVPFGQSGPFDPSKVIAMQLFLVNPKEPASLIVAKISAYGSSKDRVKGEVFSQIDDRKDPTKLPVWTGKRPPVNGDWVQTLNQSFDGNKLDTNVWAYQFWWAGLLGNQDQAYSPSMTSVKNGILNITFEKKTSHQNDDPKQPTRPYTTGMICTYDKWAQKYGYFEARIKLPTARGLWPAFWIMPDRGKEKGPEGWKRESTDVDGMEIDIMEVLTEWGPGRNNVAVHWDGYNENHKNWGSNAIYYGPTTDGFHTFGLLWEKGKLTWFIDGIKKATFESERVGSTPGYMILNIQSGNWATKNVDLSKLPDKMEVDYVRVWQLKDRLKK